MTFKTGDLDDLKELHAKIISFHSDLFDWATALNATKVLHAVAALADDVQDEIDALESSYSTEDFDPHEEWGTLNKRITGVK